jgi:hypothetical protein
MFNTESPAGVELRPPRRPMPRKAQMALAVTAGALLILSGAACAAMGGRDASADDTYTAGRAITVAPNASTSEVRTDDRPQRAVEQAAPRSFQPRFFN